MRHHFPLDAEYEIKVSLMRNGFDQVPRFNDQHALEVTIDGERARAVHGGRGAATRRRRVAARRDHRPMPRRRRG